MSEQSKNTKATRQRCWKARDEYWNCMESNPDDPDADSKCQEARKCYTNLCPAAWVVHFDKQHRYNAYKQQIEKSGVEDMDKKNTSKID